jgi:hypothetical protein
VGGDWTKNTPEVEFPYIANVYTLFGAKTQAENTHFPKEKHGYEEIKRQAMYPFMVKHLSLDPTGVFDDSIGEMDERKNTLETPAQMRVFDKDNPLPKHALKPGSPVEL